MIRRELTKGDMLNSSRDENEGPCRSGEGGGVPVMQPRMLRTYERKGELENIVVGQK